MIGGRVDMDAVKSLDARRAAERWGMIHQPQPRRDRWALSGLEKTATIEFHPDGGFTHHRLGVTGSVIDLVIVFLCGGTHHDQARFGEALHWIAEREGLWVDYEPLRQNARKLAFKPEDTAGRWMTRIVEAIESGRGLEAQRKEAMRLLVALGVEWTRWTLAPQVLGDEACLCWIPAVPWHGRRVFRDVQGSFKGWTRQSCLEHWSHKASGRVFAVDLDGVAITEDSEERRVLPRLSLVHRLRSGLAKLGFPARAVVISSWGESSERGKVHLYFVARAAASSDEVFRRWHELLDEAIEQVISGWKDEPQDERRAFARDRGTHQISRLMRLPGFNKASKDAAGVVLATFEGARVDFEGRWETRPVEVGDETEGQRWLYGKRLVHFKQNKDGDESACVLATNVWPLAITVDIEDGSRGVRFRYHDDAGRARYGFVGAESWIDKGPARLAASTAAKSGVDIKPWKGVAFAMALGQWASRAKDPPVMATVSRPGWHKLDARWIYVNGPWVHGADWIYQGKPGRGQVQGTLEAWREGVSELASTLGLWLALGCAFAGALVGPLRRDAFILHLAGASRSGKSRASMLAASVWQDPKDVLKYNGSEKGLTLAVERFDGACVVLDEIKEMPPHKVGHLVHTLTDGRSRTLAERSGQDTIGVRRWSLVGLSTGEVTIAEYLGASTQGGHTVRGIDLRIERGDCTEDARHADALDHFIHRQHGHAGNAWAAWLTALGSEGWERIAADIDTLVADLNGESAHNAEEQSILRSMATAGIALAEAHRAGIIEGHPKVDMPGFASDLVRWAMSRIVEERGEATDPESRAYEALQTLYQTQPGRFPDEERYTFSNGHISVVGVSEVVREPRFVSNDTEVIPKVPTGKIFTTESMLKASPVLTQAGVGARRFLSWCQERGFSAGSQRLEVGGRRGRWHLIELGLQDTSREAP